MADAGDVDGDGKRDVALLLAPSGNQRTLEIRSIATGQTLWSDGVFPFGYGRSMVGDLDLDGDGRSEFVTLLADTSVSNVYVYNSNGTLRYTLPILQAHNGVAVSVGKLPDIDNDGHDELLIGVMGFPPARFECAGLRMVNGEKPVTVWRPHFMQRPIAAPSRLAA
jgi:hypothetical protein